MGSRLSYVWLVIYSAVVRKRTAMPYIPPDQRQPPMAQHLQLHSGVAAQTPLQQAPQYQQQQQQRWH